MTPTTKRVAPDTKRIKVRDGVISTVCRKAALSRAALFRELGFAGQTGYRIDTGRVDPSPAFIAALMDFTGAPFELLFEIVRSDADKAAHIERVTQRARVSAEGDSPDVARLPLGGHVTQGGPS